MRKRKSLIMIILLFWVFVFSGCATVNYHLPIKSSVRPKPDKGYLYGRFSLQHDFMNKFRLALRFENIDNGDILSIRLLDNKPVYAVEVNPGEYQFKDIVYAPLGAMMDFEITKIAVPDKPAYLHDNITVEAGKVYYLGDFSGSSRRASVGTSSSGSAFAVCAIFKGGLVDIKQNFKATTEELKQLLPQLTNLEFNLAWQSMQKELQ